jgi:methionyl-tRNA formyltransferase
VTIAARTVFFGSGAFAVPILATLADSPEVSLAAVVSAPDRPAGRRGGPTATPVTDLARRLGIALVQPERLRAPDAMAAVQAVRPQLGVLADYGLIVPGAMLDLFPDGILNVHPSLLPRHRGATPIQAAILAGDARAGVSVIRMDAGTDTGPIVASVDWPLGGSETAPEVEAVAARAGADLVTGLLRAWLDSAIAGHPQDEALATLTRPLSREDGRLDPSRGAAALERQVRAYQPWPGSFLETPGGRLVVWGAEVGTELTGDTPGRLEPDADGGLALTTAGGRLRLREVQPAGGRRMSGAELLRGRPGLAGARVA